MQRLLIAYCVLLTLAVGYLLLQRQQQAIAYVDSAKLLSNYQAVADARKDFTIKSKKWQANIDTLSADMQRAVRSYERKASGMTPQEQTLARELMRAKQKELTSYQHSIQETAQQEQAKSSQQAITTANAFLDRYGKSHGYDLILIASPGGAIAYAKKGLDVTEEVTQELNKEYGKPTAP